MPERYLEIAAKGDELETWRHVRATLLKDWSKVRETIRKALILFYTYSWRRHFFFERRRLLIDW